MCLAGSGGLRLGHGRGVIALSGPAGDNGVALGASSTGVRCPMVDGGRQMADGWQLAVVMNEKMQIAACCASCACGYKGLGQVGYGKDWGIRHEGFVKEWE